MRILLIGAGEDEKLRAALRRGQVSFDGQAAGETLYLPENVYDVLVFFSAKPDAELFSTISQLRGENIDTPVLVLAEHATARSRIRLLDAGADNVLPYPYQQRDPGAYPRPGAARAADAARGHHSRGSDARPEQLRAAQPHG